MRVRFALPLILCAVASSAQNTPDVSGKWKLTTIVREQATDQQCTFTQNGADLSGVCLGEQGENKVTGKVDGNTIKFSYVSNYDNAHFNVKYEGKLSDAEIKGDVEVEGFGLSGDFTATRVPK